MATAMRLMAVASVTLTVGAIPIIGTLYYLILSHWYYGVRLVDTIIR